MTGKDHSKLAPHPAAKRALHGSGRRRWSAVRRGTVRFLRHRYIRRLFWGSTVTLALVTVGCLALWWRLASGPIDLEMATPWLEDAIEENFGRKPERFLTDGGNNSGEIMHEMEQRGVEFYAPVASNRPQEGNPAKRDDPTQPVSPADWPKLPRNQQKQLD